MFFLVDLILLLVVAAFFVYYIALHSREIKFNVAESLLVIKSLFYNFTDTVQIFLILLLVQETVVNYFLYGKSLGGSSYISNSIFITNGDWLNFDLLKIPTIIIELLIYPDWLFSEINLMFNLLAWLILVSGIIFFSYIKIYFARLHSGYYFPLELSFFVFVIILALRFLLHAHDIFLIIILLEIISFSAIILISGQHTRYGTLSSWTIEAALKYFLMGGLALILFSFSGILLTYLTGSASLLNVVIFDLFFDHILAGYYEIFYLIYVLFFSAFFIKLGAAPFHYWVADVYDGSDFLITVLLMTLISPVFLLKLILLSKLLIVDFIIGVNFFQLFFSFCGCLSILFGTLGAFTQRRLKRFLAFASIVHSGFVLLFLSTMLVIGFGGAFFYVFCYWFMLILLFSLFFIFKYIYPFHYFTYLNDLKIIVQGGLFFICILAILLLSFAGIPPFMGFFSKYFLFVVLLIDHQYFLVFFLIPMFLINAYLYMRLISLVIFELREVENNSDHYYVTGIDSYQIFETYDDVDFFFIPEPLIFLFQLTFFFIVNVGLIVFYLDWVIEHLFYFFFFFLVLL